MGTCNCNFVYLQVNKCLKLELIIGIFAHIPVLRRTLILHTFPAVTAICICVCVFLCGLYVRVCVCVCRLYVHVIDSCRTLTSRNFLLLHKFATKHTHTYLQEDRSESDGTQRLDEGLEGAPASFMQRLGGVDEEGGEGKEEGEDWRGEGGGGAEEPETLHRLCPTFAHDINRCYV